MSELAALPIVVVIIACLVAAVTDVRDFKIYNALTLPLIGSGLVFHTITAGGAGLVASLAALCVGGGVLLLPYLLGGIGGGDVKLMAGVGAWFGLPLTLYVFIIAALATGAYSLFLLARHGGLGRAVVHFRVIGYQLRALTAHFGSEEKVDAMVHQEDRHRRLVPFGVMVAMAVVVALVWGRV
jgi:prepilin peptidase CpaA